jgi:hypothetical protein
MKKIEDAHFREGQLNKTAQNSKPSTSKPDVKPIAIKPSKDKK